MSDAATLRRTPKIAAECFSRRATNARKSCDPFTRKPFPHAGFAPEGRRKTPRKLQDGLSDRAGDRAPQGPETGLVEVGPGSQERRSRRLRVADDVEMVAEHEARGVSVEGLRPRGYHAVVRGR